MKAKQLAALLMQHPEKTVNINVYFTDWCDGEEEINDLEGDVKVAVFKDDCNISKDIYETIFIGVTDGEAKNDLMQNGLVEVTSNKLPKTSSDCPVCGGSMDDVEWKTYPDSINHWDNLNRYDAGAIGENTARGDIEDINYED